MIWRMLTNVKVHKRERREIANQARLAAFN
jgi:hypothetical protein